MNVLTMLIFKALVHEIYNSVQIFEPFRDQNPHFLWKISLWWFFIKVYQKPISSITLWPNHLGIKNSGRNLDFCGSYFLFHLWNWVFRTNMESNAALMLQFEDFAMNIVFFFFKYVLVIIRLESNFSVKRQEVHILGLW